MQAQIMTKLEEHDKIFESIECKFDAIDKRFESVDRRFDAMDERFESVDRRFDAIDERFHEFGLKLEVQEAKIDQVLEIAMHTLEQVSETNKRWAQVENHEVRLSAVELAYKALMT